MTKTKISFYFFLIVFYSLGCTSSAIQITPFDALSPSLEKSKQTQINGLWKTYLTTGQLNRFKYTVKQMESLCDDCYERWEMEADYALLLANPRETVSYYLNAL